MPYTFIPILIGVAAASFYIESVKKKAKRKEFKIEIPKEAIKLVDKNEIKVNNKEKE